MAQGGIRWLLLPFCVWWWQCRWCFSSAGQLVKIPSSLLSHLSAPVALRSTSAVCPARITMPSSLHPPLPLPPPPSIIVAWQAIPSTDFSWASITLSATMQSAENSQMPIGLLVFGFQSHAGYGFLEICAAIPTLLSCEDLVCKERCEMDGQPECLQETFSICWLAGGPHYCSFHGKTFDFMGTCAYTLTTICDPDPTLPAFSVEVKKRANGNSKVSSITIHVDNVTVTAVPSENGMVRVNNHLSHLPISSHGKLHIHQKGKSMLIQSNFKLKVLYKWDDHVVIKLLAALSGKVCGMCRNNRELWDDALCLDALAYLPNSTHSICGLACLPTCSIPTVSSSCSTVSTCVDTYVTLKPTPALPL
nr:IgGFc-binding protein isoform X1 [Taeniopygia guttata]XP_041567648.1 IgGFc-binding protein isoform X1 [Taeniopygia guttata]XP_041567649.1 IgGFc-binding protein isoform X1 [Taeniopygia guttata]XP_041567650.1 IgGFc-binding protein isoform X1 [Taeniopygia guttata]XP_041567651.1 IgGFc-binding protein isoform X1 [Taeniopygia guttata]XP_041567652.1 IgGFc-binding protein isoform X1 [Taeniopygia guttata]